jgi:hypothetical protein
MNDIPNDIPGLDFLDEDIRAEESMAERELESIRDAELPVLVTRFEALKAEKAALSQREKEVNAQLKILEEERIPEKMRQLGLVKGNRGSFTTATGMRVSLRTDLYVSVNKSREEDFFEYLREHGAGDLIKETVHPSTLKAWGREQRENGQELPDNLVNSYEVTKATLTKK